MKLGELHWIKIARKYIGLRENKSRAAHNPTILKFARDSFSVHKQTAWIKDDETPWCGTFVGGVLVEAGLSRHVPKSFFRALDWAKVGTPLYKPAYGCVVVFKRNGGGHVGFVVGKDQKGNIMVLGGNQGDAVNIKPFSPSRVVGYRWCGSQSQPAPDRYNLPLIRSDGKVSTNEA